MQRLINIIILHIFFYSNYKYEKELRNVIKLDSKLLSTELTKKSVS